MPPSELTEGNLPCDFGKGHLERARSVWRNGIPRSEIRIVETLLRIQSVAQNIIGDRVEIFSVLCLGRGNCPLLSLPIEGNDLLVRENLIRFIAVILIHKNVLSCFARSVFGGIALALYTPYFYRSQKNEKSHHVFKNKINQ